jgi:RHS repeat-associated protein
MARCHLRRLTVAASVIMLIPLLVSGVPAEAARAPLPRAHEVASVKGHDAVPVKPPTDPTAGDDMTAAPAVAWPGGRSAEVDVPAAARQPERFVQAPGLPVSVAGGAAAPGRVRAELLDRAADARRGPAVRLSAVDGSGSVKLRVHYGAFAEAYGGGWASRLRLVTVPAGRELATVNDRAAKTVTAEVDATSDGVVVALEAAPSSDGGDYAATPLQASATWSAGGSSGSFGWSYPLRAPASLGGPAPTVGLHYASQSSDGRTSAGNNQPSWIGEGFDFQPGAITRAYKACATDGQSAVGDMCWGSDNATLSMSGRGGELIQVEGSPDLWRLRNDDGTRIQRLTGTANGDNDGEHWRVTTTDGTQYFFGLNRLPGWASDKPVTNSAWTVPVFGNNAGEPCNAASFASSHCTQAYQWNLDYVVDPHGNSMSYWYTTEVNNYARNRTDSAVSQYVRAGQLARIDYGTRRDDGIDSALTATPPQRVVFATLDRCITQGATCTPSTPSNWPDVPWDQQCDSAISCPGRYSPVFFTQKRLSTVTTRVATAGGDYQDVDVWTLNHVFKDPGDGREKILWLNSLSHAGKVGMTTTVPDVRFNAVQLNNRVDTSTTKNPIIRYRISSIVDEAGAVTAVTYSPVECVLGSNMPAAPDTNTKRCYPVYWTPYGATSPTFDWFHRYVVTQVTVSDTTGGAPAKVTSYGYLGGPAWHYDDGEFVPDEHKSWGQWRGYGRVRTTVGAPGTVRSQTDTLYFRGMHGDKLSSGTRTATLPVDPDFGGDPVNDEPWLLGQTRETIVYNGTGDSAPVVEKMLVEPWHHGPHATRTRGGVTVGAYTLGVRSTTTKLALDGGRGWRTTRLTNTFDYDDETPNPETPNPVGRITMVHDAGDVATANDDTCTRTTYADNATDWMLTYPVRVETVGVACSETPDPAKDVISDARTYYDGATSFGTTISRGDVTRTERMSGVSGGTRVYVQATRGTYDDYGRPRDTYDSLDRKTTIEYTPAAGAPVTATTTTNPAGWTSSQTLQPAWGKPTLSVDPNANRTEMAYDGLGRVTSIWFPGRSRSASANLVFSYVVRNSGGPSAVSTSALNRTGTGYVTGWALYDGLLRNRQVQKPAVGGGRIIADTLYDSRGLVVHSNLPYFNAAAPSDTLFTPAGAVPGRTLMTYDNAERRTASVFQASGVERWRTTIAYGGDHVDVTAPPGGVGTGTWTDARGRTVALRHYHGTSPTGAYDATTYTYTDAGQLSTMTDPTGKNVWRYTYDQLGRKKSEEDPDRGRTTYEYDDADQLVGTTDARGTTLAIRRDTLGRRTGLFLDSLSGTQLAGWTYDTLTGGAVVKGQLATATRYADDAAYTLAVTGYDPAYRQLGSSVTIPAAEGSLAGTYTTTQTYNPDGSPATVSVPAAGGLPAETLTYGYNDSGLPDTVSGLDSYVTQTDYDSLGRMSTLQLSTGGGKTLSQIWNYEDGTNRLLEHGVFDEAAGAVFRDAFHAYDAAGNVTSTKDMLGQYGGTDDNQCFRYDHLRRLRDAWTPQNGDCAAAPTKEALGGPAPYWQSFSHNAVGNRLSSTDRTATTEATETYTYPAAGAPRPHAVTSVGGQSYSYDEAGHTLTRPAETGTARLTWDAEGHLATSTDATGTTSYLYDANGDRLMRTDPTGTTLYLFGQEIRRAGNGQLSGVRFYGHAKSTVASRTNSGVTWLATDRQATATVAVDAATNSAKVRRFKPFGETRGADPDWPTDRGFVDGTDDNTGSTHLGAREYDAETGKFLSVDPLMDVANSQQVNGYSYANNNPTTLSDPTGTYPCETNECNEGPPSGSGSGSGSGTPSGSPGSGEREDPRCDSPKFASRCNKSAPPPTPWDIRVTITYTHGTVLVVFFNGRVMMDGLLLPAGRFDPEKLAAKFDELRGRIKGDTASKYPDDPRELTLEAHLRRIEFACSMAQGCHEYAIQLFEMWKKKGTSALLLCGEFVWVSGRLQGGGASVCVGVDGDGLFSARRLKYGIGKPGMNASGMLILDFNEKYGGVGETYCSLKGSVAGSYKHVTGEVVVDAVKGEVDKVGIGVTTEHGGIDGFFGVDCSTVMKRW